MSSRKWHEFGPFTVFDVETTGMSPVYDRIVEVAAVRIDVNGEITRFQSLVNPGCRIPPQVSCVHLITDEMVADAPKFHEVGYKLLDMAKGSTMVAHNARFDLGFLQESLARSGMELWKGKTLDSIRLMKEAYRGLPSYSLQNLRRTFQLDDGFESMQAHRAAADAEWTLQILKLAFTALLKNAE
jgi:DNA polymerase III epsilon subunit family exonuclease